MAVQFIPIPGVGPILAGAITGFAGGMIVGRGNLTVGLIGAVTGAAFAGLGQAYGQEGYFGAPSSFGDHVGKRALYGTVGGVSQELAGGEFSAGFLSASFVSGARSAGIIAPYDGDTSFGDVARATVVGGTASELGGGKFVNGAGTGAFLAASVAASEYYERFVGGRAQVGAAPKQLSSRPNLYPSYKPETYNPAAGVPSLVYDIFGVNAPLTDNFFADFFKQGSASMRFAQIAVGVGDATSHLHDRWLNALNANSIAVSIGTMLPAYGVSAAAVYGNGVRDYGLYNSLRTSETFRQIGR